MLGRIVLATPFRSRAGLAAPAAHEIDSWAIRAAGDAP
jgi:hypothetical protein